jgi:hypothetical protein
MSRGTLTQGGTDTALGTGPESAAESPVGRNATRDRTRPVAAIVFGVYVAVALPLILFDLGAERWFFRDDWFFIAGHGAIPPNDFFRPSGFNSHWTTLPNLVYRLLWSLVGLRSYVPYQAVTVVLHLTAAVLLRAVMRRAGVRPWIATCAAASFVLFGPGEQNIVWAFQMCLVGSLVFGLVQLILADHDGPFDRRDWLGLAAGVVALMCSGVGTTMAVIVGIATFLRRGWRIASMHTAPLAAVYFVYTRVEHPAFSPFGRPSPAAVWRWVVHNQSGVFLAMGHFWVVAVALGLALVVGLVLLASRKPRGLGREASVPAALLIGGVLFAASAAFGRWTFGVEFARSNRYMHLGAAFALPALAVAAEAIVRRRRALLPVVLALFLLPIPWNIAAFGTAFFVDQESTVVNAARVPFAEDVPRDTRPVDDGFMDKVDIGFLLDAKRDGKLPNQTAPISPRVVNELKVRLGVVQAKGQNDSPSCRTSTVPIDIAPKKGDRYRTPTGLAIVTHDGARATSNPVFFEVVNGRNLTIQLDGLELRLMPVFGAHSFTVCS